MATPTIAPQLKVPVEKKASGLRESKPIEPKRSVRNLLVEIFEGHEEFLGCTPD
ncbi:MAG: hypothetical protein ABSD75_00215 [Terriglobales bacterium]